MNMPGGQPSADRVCAIGLDVGGTKIAAGVVTAGGELIERMSVPTPPAEDESVTQDLILDVVGKLSKSWPVQAIGVGAAGMVEWPEGHIRWAPNNSYRDLPLRALLSGETGLPAVVDNDANTAAWAEYRLGAGDGHADLAVLTVGTGIGAGLILAGALYRGSSGLGGEFGHMIVNPGGTTCGCGSDGCLEAMASGSALGRAGRAAAMRDPGGVLASLAGEPGKVTGETVFEAARNGDPAARSLFADAGYWLGVGIASLVTLLDLQQVVVGGGLSRTGDLLLGPTRASFERFLFSRSRRTVPAIVPARFGTEAGLVGAGLLALELTGAAERQAGPWASSPSPLPG